MPLVMREVEKLQEVDRLTVTLDIAEAFNVAYVGSKGGKNSGALKRWRSKMIGRITRLLGQERKTAWDTMRKSKRF